MIELNTINPNVNSFVHSRLGLCYPGCSMLCQHTVYMDGVYHARILFEFPAAGGVLIRQEVAMTTES